MDKDSPKLSLLSFPQFYIPMNNSGHIFSSSTVKFQVIHGDILTRDFTASDKIVAAVWEQVKSFMGNIYKKVIYAALYI